MSLVLSSPRRILVVDDEPSVLLVTAHIVRELGHSPVTAAGGRSALELLDHTFDLVLLDVLMPDMDGFEVVRHIRDSDALRSIPVIMVTGAADMHHRLRAVEAGANDFISKPLERAELAVRMNSLLRMKDSQDQLKRYQARLEEMVEVRTLALQMAMENLQLMQRSTLASQQETILRLSSAAEYKDEHTAMHLKRMSEFSALLAEKLGLPGHDVNLVRQASPMHDVGKIGVPDNILLKPGKLDAHEWVVMRKHTLIGREILQGSTSELLQVGEQIAVSHHEKYDGTGYPYGLRGEDIPLFGRICAVADVFDALTSYRPYKRPFTNDKALAIMAQAQSEGTHFDPHIYAVFLDNFREILDIQKSFQDSPGARSLGYR